MFVDISRDFLKEHGKLVATGDVDHASWEIYEFEKKVYHCIRGYLTHGKWEVSLPDITALRDRVKDAINSSTTG